MQADSKILALVPEGCRVNWNEKMKTFYVYKSQYVYVPEKKRGKEIRTSVGTIKDGKFKYSKNYLAQQALMSLNQKNTEQTQSAVDSKEVLASQVQETITDKRQSAKVIYPLDYVFLVAFLSALSGRTSCVQIADFWKNNHPALSEIFPDFPKQYISHDTVRRLLMLVDPSEFQKLYKHLVAPLIYQFHQRIVAVDGQAVRASKTAKVKTGKYVLSFFDTENGVVLGQKLIGEKENEITHAADMVEGLDLHGCVVTADALNTQTKFANALIKKGADYCLAVKENHKELYLDLQLAFLDVTETRTKKVQNSQPVKHGRVENRDYSVLPGSVLSSKHLDKWPGLDEGCIVRTVTKSIKKTTEQVSELARYYICSLNFDNPHITEQIARAIRRHWAIENELHYVLDVDFNQDRTQCKNANYIQNRTLLNKTALAIIRNAQKQEIELTGKEPISVKRFMEKFSVLDKALEALPTAIK